MSSIPYSKADVCYLDLRNNKTGEIYEGEYIDMRLQPDTIPKGKHAYNCRHGDNGDWWTPCTIESGCVMVNFAGVFITDRKIIFPEGLDYICVTLID